MSDISLQMPDGSTIKFPAGTSPEVMSKVAKTHLAKQGASPATPAPTTPLQSTLPGSPAAAPRLRTQDQSRAQVAASIAEPAEREAIDAYRLKYFNYGYGSADINKDSPLPQQVASALALNSTDKATLARLRKMSPIGQKTILEKAQEYKAENDRTAAVHPLDFATSLQTSIGGNPALSLGYQEQEVQKQHGNTTADLFKGAEGARQNKTVVNGKPNAALNVVADFASFGATPEGAAAGMAFGQIAQLGKVGAGLATVVGTGIGESDALNRYEAGDIEGAKASALLGLLPIGVHALGSKIAGEAGKLSDAVGDAIPKQDSGNLMLNRGDVEIKSGVKGKVRPKPAPLPAPGVRIGTVTPKTTALPHDVPVVKPKPAEGINTPHSENAPSNPKPETVSGFDPDFSITDTPKRETVSGREGDTKVANEHTDAERKRYNLPPLTKGKLQGHAAIYEEAFRQGLHEKAVGVAQEVLEHPRQMTAEEIAANAMKSHQLKHDMDLTQAQVKERLAAGEDPADLQAKYNGLRTDYDTLTQATGVSGTSQSEAFSIRKYLIPSEDDFTSTDMQNRMEMADPKKPLTPAEAKSVADIHEEHTQAEAELQKHLDSEPESVAKAEESLTEAKKSVRVGKRIARAGDRAALDTEYEGLKKKFIQKATGQLNSLVDPTLIPIIKDMARNRVHAGALTVADVVDSIHADLLPHVAGLLKRDVRDAWSGYGEQRVQQHTQIAELREQARWMSKIDDVNAPLPKNAPRVVSDAVKALKGQHQQAQDNLTPEQREYQSVQRQIKSLKDKLTGTVEANPVRGTVDTEEMGNARGELKGLRAELAKRQKAAGPASNSPYDTETVRLKNRLAEVEAKVKAGDTSQKARPTAATVDTPETMETKRQIAEAEKKLSEMRESAKPPEHVLAEFRTKLEQEIAETERKIKAGEGPNTKAKKLYDAKTQALIEKRNRVRQKFRASVEARKPKGILDKYTKFHRALVLSRVTTLERLGGAAFQRALFTPVEEAAGKAMRLIPSYGKIADKAPHGTGSLRAEGAAVRGMTAKSNLTDMAQMMKTGQKRIDVLHGAGDSEMHESGPMTLQNFGQRLHGAIKTPIQNAAFERSMVQQEIFERRHGNDPTDPTVRATMEARAYQRSKASILMQDNAITHVYNGAINAVERNQKYPKLGKAMATGLRAAMPIVKIPTNFAGEVISHTPGAGLIRPIYEVASSAYEHGLTNAIEKMSPEAADIVTTALKKHAVGTALFAIGYYGYKDMGGVYVQHGNKANDLAPGAVRVKLFGKEMVVDKAFLHSPQMEVMQMGAAFRQATERAKGDKGDKFEAGAYTAAAGEAELVPFVDAPLRWAKASEGPDQGTTFAGEEAAGLTVPGLAPDVAAMFDKDKNGRPIKRKPKGAIQGFEYGAGARKLVPQGR